MAVDLVALLRKASSLVSEKNLLELTGMIWAHDRFFTFPAFQTTAKTVSAKFAEWGVKSETTELPADGKTMFGDWRMPLGWDCTEATAEIVEPAAQRGRVLADRKKHLAHVVMWSGPTPPEGITAEVVKIADAAELKSRAGSVKGKIVYTSAHPLELKKTLAEAGALAVLSSFVRFPDELADACCWVNSWSDTPGGWAFHAGDTPLPGLTLTPHAGKELNELLSRGPVKLKLRVLSKYMETTMPVVAGFVAGSEPQEILAIGHAMEQGANDNASGCAVIMESLRVLRQATASGELGPLRRGVRGVLTNECYGTLGYAVRNPEIVQRTIAGINWDSVARHQESAGARFRHIQCADASASVADTLMALLLESWLTRATPYLRFQKDQPFGLTDNAYCDPALGVECVYVDSQDKFWHTSADTMAQVSGATLHAFAAVSVAYLHFLASAGPAEALWLALRTGERYGKRLQSAAADCATRLATGENNSAELLACANDYLEYICLMGEQALDSALRLVSRAEAADLRKKLGGVRRHLRRLADLEKRRLKELAGCKPAALPAVNVVAQTLFVPAAQRPAPAEIADLAARRPRKKFIGTPAYDSLSPQKVASIGSPRWNGALHSALFWSQGKLPFGEIVRRVNFEFRSDNTAVLAKHFRFMAENGLLEWRDH